MTRQIIVENRQRFSERGRHDVRDSQTSPELIVRGSLRVRRLEDAHNGVRLPASTLPGVILNAVVGAVTFCCLGYALSTFIRSADAAQPMIQAIMLPLYFISGVFIPNVNLPGWLQDVAKFFPVAHLAGGLRHAFDPGTHGIGVVWSDIGVLALWGGVGLFTALARFTWTPAAATGTRHAP